MTVLNNVLYCMNNTVHFFLTTIEKCSLNIIASQQKINSLPMRNQHGG
jgi:hypothetical protein